MRQITWLATLLNFKNLHLRLNNLTQLQSWQIVGQRVYDVLKEYPRLRLTHGRKVLEVRPMIDWDKGKAVTFLLESLATGARDMIGLDKSCTSFSSQVFYSLGTQRKITLCLSPTFGVVQHGKVAHESQPSCVEKRVKAGNIHSDAVKLGETCSEV
ncbi:hypothetical protein JHK85_051480 [Glycine max]|nr:hypothetical protein JHK85_051480 [Glycine max]